MNLLYTKHTAVERFVKERRKIDLVRPSFFREHLIGLPRGSTIIGNLPVPTAALICAAGHHYQHVMIPRARHGGTELPALRAYAWLAEFHVEEID